MKLKKLALLAEVVSGVAIVATLVILVFQVRGNTAMLQRQIDIDRAFRDANEFVGSEYMPDILTRIKEVDVGTTEPAVEAFMDRYGLSLAESDRFVRWLRRAWRSNEADLSANGPSDALYRAIQTGLSFPDQALFFENSRWLFGEEFVRYVDSVERLNAPPWIDHE